MADLGPDSLAPILYAAMARAVAEWGRSVPDWDDVACANNGDLAAARDGWLAAARAAREQVAAEIEAEAAGHLHSIRRAMRWAAWIARGKPAESDPGNDHDLSGALLHGDAERTGWPCCPVETASVARALGAERERIRAAAGSLKVTLARPGNGPGRPQEAEVVPLPALLGILGPEPASAQAEAVAAGRAGPGEGDGTPEAASGPDGGEEGDWVTVRVQVPRPVDHEDIYEIQQAAQEWVDEQYAGDEDEDEEAAS